MQIGIVGNGYVGGATALLGDSDAIEALIYDRDPEKCSPLELTLKDLTCCSFIFLLNRASILWCSCSTILKSANRLLYEEICQKDKLNKIIYKATIDDPSP